MKKFKVFGIEEGKLQKPPQMDEETKKIFDLLSSPLVNSENKREIIEELNKEFPNIRHSVILRDLFVIVSRIKRFSLIN